MHSFGFLGEFIFDYLGIFRPMHYYYSSVIVIILVTLVLMTVGSRTAPT